MAKLFISHASEDKDAFVRELALTMRSAGHEVWYDEFVLKAGDSLRAEIDKGLKAADYGVVVLSKAFFAKHWTQVELDGLYALEDENRKLILPVWHEVTFQDVKGYSPTLAGRFGISSARGVADVAEQLEWAMSTSTRTRELDAPKTGVARLLAVSARISDREAEQARLFSIPGVQEVQESARQISAAILTMGDALAASDKAKRYVARSGYNNTVIVDGPFQLFVTGGLGGMMFNSAREAEFTLTIGLRAAEYSQQAASVREVIDFKPRMLGTAPVSWDESKGKVKGLNPTQVTGWIFDKFAEHVEQASSRL